VGPRVALEERKELRSRLVLDRLGGLAQLLDALIELGAVADAQHELAARGAERLVDAGEHPAQPCSSVRREELQAVLLPARAELGERTLERLAAEHRRLRVVQLAEARVEAGGEGVGLQQPQAEAV